MLHFYRWNFQQKINNKNATDRTCLLMVGSHEIILVWYTNSPFLLVNPLFLLCADLPLAQFKEFPISVLIQEIYWR